MFSKIFGLGAITVFASAAVFAEPSIQPGDTLESLSKAKVTTTVNGQPGSLQELISSGQIKPAAETPAMHTPAPNAAVSEAPAPAADPNAPAQALPELPSSAEAPVNAEQPPAADMPIQAAPETPAPSELPPEAQ